MRCLGWLRNDILTLSIPACLKGGQHENSKVGRAIVLDVFVGIRFISVWRNTDGRANCHLSADSVKDTCSNEDISSLQNPLAYPDTATHAYP